MKLSQLHEARYAQNKYVDWLNTKLNQFIEIIKDTVVLYTLNKRPQRVSLPVEPEDVPNAIKGLKQALGPPIVERDSNDFFRWMIEVEDETFYVDLDVSSEPLTLFLIRKPK